MIESCQSVSFEIAALGGMEIEMSIVSKLPPNFMMQTTGLDTPAISMSFTLTTLEHVEALRAVLKKAVIPMLKTNDTPTDTGSVT